MRKATKFALQRLSVVLMLMMLTMTAWADETLTFTFYKDADYSYMKCNNGTPQKLSNKSTWTTGTATFGDLTVTITVPGTDNINWVGTMAVDYQNVSGCTYTLTYASTFTFSHSSKYVGHVKLYGMSGSGTQSTIVTKEVDTNSQSCSVYYNNNSIYKIELAISDTKPTHYYDITYELNGGENNSSNPTQYEMATGVTSFYDATRTGYHFDGWFSNSGLTDAITSIPANTTGAKTLYAGWTINQYTLSFNTNGGTPATIAAITQDYGTPITAPADPSREGYTFAGWNPALPTTMPAASNTHTAQWDIVDYDINYTLNGGTVVSANPATYNVETNTFTLNNPTKTGYTFNGWTGSNGTTPQTTVTITKGSTTGSLNYTANWTPITYSVAFNGNGNTGGSMDAQSLTYDVAKALTSNSFSRAFTVTYAYNGATSDNSEATATATATFSGWAESANGEKVYDDGQSVSNLATENNATVNLFAKWTDGIVTLPTPAKTGYTFGGWYSDSGLNTSVGDGGASYTPSEDITIYAKWIVNKYTITFDTGTGGTVIDPIEQDYDSDITPPANPTRDGCTFAGWDKPIPTKMPAEDMTITAQWTLITYNITYDLANGELPTGQSNPATYNVETETITLVNPLLPGYYFNGWTGNNGTAPETTVTIKKGSTGDKSYTANWSLCQYSITYNLNGGAFDPGVIAPTGYNISTEDIIINAGPFREGYTFAGWTGTDLDSPTSPITIPAGSTGNRSYTAQWSPNAYNIFYYLNGGTNAAGNPAYYYIYSPTFTINPPTREGYTFVGWTGWIYTTPQTTITIPTGTMGNKSLTAHWSKDYSSVWSEGMGTENDPYIISSTTDLDQLATMVNAGENFSATYFKLGCDIAYNPNVLTIDSDDDGIMDSNYKAIGYSDCHYDEQKKESVGNIRNFSGKFDGDGHTISGIRIGRGGNTLYDDNQGLFGWAAGGTVKNVTLADADITGKKSVGGIVGFNAGVIENCHVKSDVFIRAAQNGASFHGGIAGSNAGTTISHCTSAAILSIDTSVDASTCNLYGGIAGDASGKISNNLVVGATVPAVGVAEPAVGQYYGAIGSTDGEARYVEGAFFDTTFGGNISNNYYANCTVGGVANATNVGLGYEYENYNGNYDLLDSGTRTTDWTENDGAVSATILSESAAVPSTLNGKVVFRRTFKAGQPSTLCLPFSFVPDQTTQGKVYEFGGVNDQWRVQMNNIQRSDATAATVANQPYGFIPVIPDGKQAGDEVVVIFRGTASGATVAADHTQVGNWDMHGTYERVDWSSGYWYGYNAANGVFSHCISGAYFPAYRCYLVFTPPSATRGNLSLGTTLPDQMGVDFNDSVNPLTTGVTSITVQTAQDAWYTLDGRKLDAEPTKKGIYIYKGKKVIK